MLEKTAYGGKEYSLIPLLPVSINVSDHLRGFNFCKLARMSPKADSFFLMKELLFKCHAPLPASDMCLSMLWKKPTLSLCKESNF